ncbi:hypothetical protein HYH02_012672 [Chlamydomonas schloesseri]|uniref:Uncharacterized protein n=1 Tax=Chlamydomonas schloesseri TaxID=2026947 RepID=A0A835VZF5_9CHLO|nr:hypothetical protein HYH02_012672 [Chlamydomonas schloesseri]|eukprot:KAG2433555.1 hypothetical protein HYH02_012672 [Chlamydomonas schloesseri]
MLRSSISAGIAGHSDPRVVHWLGICHAFSSSRGLSRGSTGRGGPHRPHHAPPPDQKACTLGRRPDVFNGDAARILGQQPQPAQQRQPPEQPAAQAPAGNLPPAGQPAASGALVPSTTTATLNLPVSSSTPPAAAALWCEQLRHLNRTATATQRRLDELLRDLDTLELGTSHELRAAERLGKVLATYLSFAFPGAAGDPEPGANAAAATGPSSAAHLRALLARVEAAAAQLAAIGRRHEAGAYAPLRRFYFSPDEPLIAISLRSEQYRRQLEGAAAACGPDSPEVANLVEEVAAALSSHTITAFLELEGQRAGAPGAPGVVEAIADSDMGSAASSTGSMREGEAAAQGRLRGYVGEGDDEEMGARGAGEGSLERLAVAAAADYYSLQELRQELEVVGRSAEAAGVPVGQLLRLADLEM